MYSFPGADVVALYIVLAEFLAERDTMRNIHRKNQRFTVFFTAFEVSVNNKPVTHGGSGDPRDEGFRHIVVLYDEV